MTQPATAAPSSTEGPVEEVTFDLEGRIFRVPLQTSTRQDGYIYGILEQHSMTVEMQDILSRMGNEDAVRQGMTHFIGRLYRNGAISELLGATLRSQPGKWTVQEAKANADFIADVSAPAAKEQLNQLAHVVLLSFFVSAFALQSSSPDFSPASTPGAPGSDSNMMPEANATPAPATEAPSSAASGQMPSGTLLDTTMTPMTE